MVSVGWAIWNSVASRIRLWIVNGVYPAARLGMWWAVIAIAAAHAASPIKLQATAIVDWRAAGMGGTGCYWSRRSGGPVLLAAAGRKAMLKVGRKTVLLAPCRAARELFPFTYDAWRAGKLTIRIVDTRIVRAMGDESVTTDALLVVSRRGATVGLRGSMICGS